MEEGVVKFIHPFTINLKTQLIRKHVYITPYYITIHESPSYFSIKLVDPLVPYKIDISHRLVTKRIEFPKELIKHYIETLPEKFSTLLLYAAADFLLKKFSVFYFKNFSSTQIANDILRYSDQLYETLKEDPHKYDVITASSFQIFLSHSKTETVKYRFRIRLGNENYIGISAISPNIKGRGSGVFCKRKIMIKGKSITYYALNPHLYNPYSLVFFKKLLYFYKEIFADVYLTEGEGSLFSIPFSLLTKYSNIIYDFRYILADITKDFISSLMEFDKKYIKKYSKDLDEYSEHNSLFDLMETHSIVSYFPDDSIVAIYLRYPEEHLFYAVYPLQRFKDIKSMRYFVIGEPTVIIRNKNEEKYVFIADSIIYYLFLAAAFVRADFELLDKILFNAAKLGLFRIAKMYSWEILDLLKDKYKWSLDNNLSSKLNITIFTPRPGWMDGSSVAVDFVNPKSSFKTFFSEKLFEKLDEIGVKDNIIYIVFSRWFMWKWNSMPEGLKEEYSKTQEAILLK